MGVLRSQGHFVASDQCSGGGQSRDRWNDAEYLGKVGATLEKLSSEMAESASGGKERAAAAGVYGVHGRQKSPREYSVRALSSKNDDVPDAVIPVLEGMKQEITELRLVIVELCKRAGGLEDGIPGFTGVRVWTTADRSPRLGGRCFVCGDRRSLGTDRCPSRRSESG